MLFIGGLIFDIMGRKWPLFFIFMGEGLVLASYPWCAPNTTTWLIMTMMYDVFKRPKKANPLIQDYVMDSSLGRAYSLKHMGHNIGTFIALLGLF